MLKGSFSNMPNCLFPFKHRRLLKVFEPARDVTKRNLMFFLIVSFLPTFTRTSELKGEIQSN